MWQKHLKFQFVVPHLSYLCMDANWGVRKAVCEVFVEVARHTSPNIRRAQLAQTFVKLLHDPSRWVWYTAFQELGPFIATFANSKLSGLKIKDGQVCESDGRCDSESIVADSVDFEKLPSGCCMPEKDSEEDDAEDSGQESDHSEDAEQIIDGLQHMLDTWTAGHKKNSTHSAPPSVIEGEPSSSGEGVGIAAKCNSSDDLSKVGLDDDDDENFDENDMDLLDTTLRLDLDDSFGNDEKDSSSRTGGPISMANGLAFGGMCLISDINGHCATYFPAVARHDWTEANCAHERRTILATDDQLKVRVSIANSIHEMAAIARCASRHPTDVSTSMVSSVQFCREEDAFEVRVGLLKHLFEFYRCLSPETRKGMIDALPQFMPMDNSMLNGNWRYRHEFAKQCNKLCEMYGIEEINRTMSAIALTLANDVVNVRIAVCRALSLCDSSLQSHAIASDSKRLTPLTVNTVLERLASDDDMDVARAARQAMGQTVGNETVEISMRGFRIREKENALLDTQLVDDYEENDMSLCSDYSESSLRMTQNFLQQHDSSS
ncbi:HEAT repeat protein [Ostertagia ostertagi]